MENSANYELINFKGKIHLINHDGELKSVSGDLRAAKELGFDTETRPAFKKGDSFKVALLQLATEQNAYLIRLHGLRDYSILKDVFENAQILKVGVAIRDDLKSLQKLFKFHPHNFIELQDLARDKGLKNFGLKGMTEEVLQARLSKRAKTSNWEAQVLSDQQIMYAATDAWIGLKLYHKINALISTKHEQN
jgi:ribonuclease D